MKRSKQFWMMTALACVLSLGAGFGTDALAQKGGRGGGGGGGPTKVHGQILDQMGNKYANLTIDFKNSKTGDSFTVTTDKEGEFRYSNAVPGDYTISFKANGQPLYDMTGNLAPGQDTEMDVNFKMLDAGSPDKADAAKKAAEARAKFAAMKGHFDAGLTALDQAKQFQAQRDKLPKEQQAPLQAQLDQSANTAITELQQALEGTSETDPNRNIVLARLGDANETIGKYPEAADAYEKAVALKPDPGYYNNLGNCLARTGKVDDALAAYQKAIDLDPMNTAMYWRNFSVGLYNSGRIKESVDPLRKATAADPTNAQAWYLLGAALVNTMDFKQDGDKLVAVLQPGTIEAYQKCIQLDPNGPYAAQAKQGLDALQAMGVGGIDTKVNVKGNKK